MCGHEGVDERTPEYEAALAGAVAQWNSLADPWSATGADRRDLRRAVMAARMQGACWGDLGDAVGAGKDDLKALFGCMPRFGRRAEGAHGESGCGGHGHGHGHTHAEGTPTEASAGRAPALELGLPVRP